MKKEAQVKAPKTISLSKKVAREAVAEGKSRKVNGGTFASVGRRLRQEFGIRFTVLSAGTKASRLVGLAANYNEINIQIIPERPLTGAEKTRLKSVLKTFFTVYPMYHFSYAKSDQTLQNASRIDLSYFDKVGETPVTIHHYGVDTVHYIISQ